MKNFKRVLSLALAALMVIGGLVIAPVDAKADETYTKVTSVDQITDDAYYVLAVENSEKYYAMKLDMGGTFVNSLEVTIEGNSIVAPDFVPVWKISKTDNGTYTLYNGEGYLSYIEAKKVELVDAVSAQEQEWNFSSTDGIFTIQNATDSATAMCYNVSSPRFSAYATGNSNMDYEIMLYKYNGTTVTYPQDIEALSSTATQDEIVAAAYKAMYNGVSLKGTYTITGVIAKDATVKNNKVSVNITVGEKAVQCYELVYGDVTEFKSGDSITVEGELSYYTTTVQINKGTLKSYTSANTDDDDDNDTTPATKGTIAEALAAEADTLWTVKGVVTLVDGQNIYIQDETGGIDAYFSDTPSDIALGDTIEVTGSRATFRGLPELASATYTKSSGLTLEAKTTTIDALTTADIATYVKLTGLTVTEVYDKDGEYSSPNITVTDGTNTIQIYKAVVNKNEDGSWAIKVGDRLDVKAAVGVYNTTLQLRNTTADEITVVADNIEETGDFSMVLPLVLVLMGGAVVIVASKKRVA